MAGRGPCHMRSRYSTRARAGGPQDVSNPYAQGMPGAVAEALSWWPMVGRHAELEAFSTVLRDRRCHAFVIHGAAGVGKTRLAQESLDQAAAAGHPHARATATRAASRIPFAAIAHLLPMPPAQTDPMAVFAALRAALRNRAAGGTGRFVLLVDDLHLLDATSAALLGQLL